MSNINFRKTDYTALEQICKKYNKNINYLLHQLTIYPDLAERALDLPPEITRPMESSTATIAKLLPMWIDNIRNNFEAIKKGKDIKYIPKTNSAALVIGAGPSLMRKKHLDLLAQRKFDGVVFVVDRILKDCLEREIIPNYVLILDGSDKILKYIDYTIVDKYAHSIGAIMNIGIHPSVVKRWKGEIYWFDNNIDDRLLPNVSLSLDLLCKKTSITTAGHASSLGWAVAFTRGYNPIVLIGVDLSYPEDVPMKETWYYDNYNKIFNGDLKKIQSIYTHKHHNFFNTDYYYEPVFDAYIISSMSHFKIAAQHGIKVINCTEGGAIEGEGVTCMRFEDYLNSEKNKKLL